MPIQVPDTFDPTRKYSAVEVAEIATALQQKYFKDASSGTTPTNQPPFGPYADGSAYGAFSLPGVRPDTFSAFSRPRSIASQFGVQPSLNANEKIRIMTGVTDGSGNNPADFCGTAPTAGQLKRCVQNYIWGKMYWKSQVVNVMEIGEYADYADQAISVNILNQRAQQNPFVPNMMSMLDLSNRSGITLNNELFNIGVQMERSFEPVFIRGNETLANTATTRGFIKEFKGLERQITTGKADLDTGVACPAADSQVLTWGTGIDQTVSGRTIVQFLRDTLFGLIEMGRQVGMEGIQYGIVMPFRLFQQLTYVWSCQYWTYACSNASASNPNFTNGQDIRALQLDMQNNYYLLIDGNRIPVFPSDGIRETQASSTIITADDIFFLPLTWEGRRLLNIQFKNLSSADVTEFANFGPAPRYLPVNNGMFLLWANHTNACMEIALGAKFRLIQDAPFLAAQLNTFQYSFQAPYRSPFPGDTAWHKDGGATRWDGNYSVAGG